MASTTSPVLGTWPDNIRQITIKTSEHMTDAQIGNRRNRKVSIPREGAWAFRHTERNVDVDKLESVFSWSEYIVRVLSDERLPHGGADPRRLPRMKLSRSHHDIYPSVFPFSYINIRTGKAATHGLSCLIDTSSDPPWSPYQLGLAMIAGRRRFSAGWLRSRWSGPVVEASFIPLTQCRLR